MDAPLLNWLLDEGNPGVRLRTLTWLFSLPRDDPQVKKTRAMVTASLDAARDLSWMDDDGLRVLYGLTALGEAGLTRSDVPLDRLANRLLAQPFDAACGDMMLLRALVMLGYGADLRVESRLDQAAATRLPDGAWLCLHRVRKMRTVPKSCIKVAMHALLLAAEMKKRSLSFPGSDQLLGYFRKRRLFYRMDDPARLVLDCRPGQRMTDVFFPIEVMRVGLPVLLDALAALGAGEIPEFQEAWALLDRKRDPEGRILLEGTLAKSYLPKERVGRPSKWATLYACSAYASRASPAGLSCSP